MDQRHPSGRWKSLAMLNCKDSHYLVSQTVRHPMLRLQSYILPISRFPGDWLCLSLFLRLSLRAALCAVTAAYNQPRTTPLGRSLLEYWFRMLVIQTPANNCLPMPSAAMSHSEACVAGCSIGMLSAKQSLVASAYIDLPRPTFWC